MAPREELVSSAVKFLQDPSVSESPVEKRIEFLQSKNLTQEEIDLALSRANDSSVLAGSASSAPQNAPYPPQTYQQPYGRPPPYGYGHGPYGSWQPPPEYVPPKRDWRDWFIMATVAGGASYGLYFLVKRYISPLISPPTPPQLEQDKAAIDAEFAKAFALLDTLSSDTAALKDAEQARTERLDKALSEVEVVVNDLKAASRRREDQNRRITDEVKGLKDDIPKALEGAKSESDKRLRELNSELKSLKLLLGNRLGSTPPPNSIQANRSGPSTPATEQPSSERSSAPPNTNNPQPPLPPSSFAHSALSNAVPNSRREGPLSGYGSGSGKAAIPAWQMAAAKASQPATGLVSPGSNSENTPVNNSENT
ncbi:MAG: hypothetical protein Q9160_002144 [Pyrenula sp. 1 TL-2023]